MSVSITITALTILDAKAMLLELEGNAVVTQPEIIPGEVFNLALDADLLKVGADKLIWTF